MSKDNFCKSSFRELTQTDNQYNIDSSLEGFARADAKHEPHLQLLFRARRPIEPLRALHKPVYDNRPLQPLIDTHHACGTREGLLGHVDKE